MGEEMREIKIRAFHKKNKKMYYHVEHSFHSLGEIDSDESGYIGGDYHGFGDVLEDEDCIAMQCVGLKDNNNKELYFDDVTETYAGNRKLGRTVIKSLDDLVNLINEITESGINFKIIGNVFENPRLMEGN